MDDVDSRWHSTPPSSSGPRRQHVRVHGLLRGVDHLFHHRDPHQAGSRPQRHRVRHPGRDADPDRLAQPHLPRDLDRPVRRAPRVHGADGGDRGRRLAARHGEHLPDVSRGRSRGGARGGLVRGRHRVRVPVVRPGPPGVRARDVRHRQRGCRGDELRGAVPPPRVRMGAHGADLRRGPPRDRSPVLPRDEGGSGHRPAQGGRRETALRLPAARALAEPPGLEVLPLLLLRLRRVRGPRPVAAPVLRWRLRARRQDRGHAGRRVRASRQRLPGARRVSLRSLRCAPRDVLDVHRQRPRLFPAELSLDGLRRTGSHRAALVQHHHLPADSSSR